MSDVQRLVAWRHELLQAHARLRLALRTAQDALRDGADIADKSRDLLLFCHGFCVALGGHHRGEDAVLFLALTEKYPESRRALGLLQDHDMIATLLGQFDSAVQSAESPVALALHLEGLAAIMESHFRFEGRELDPLLDRLVLDVDPAAVFGPL